ncbi:MAG: tRNA (N(6)-L-threonylcarbamoyladenosine(37)-C(2))-methylthiotransferase MtaB [Treponema sp.]|jgi:threonylcarbamoyladenosine tRNA methylthiotransferase MtaB|nr:tRNA (N(6)-L-threonylcarbamoyladenosine(37)-C(2))-methylthiotransferase MtaB [Treponema sp.]
MPSILIQTLGCKLNQLESEAITDAFRQAGFVMCNHSIETSSNDAPLKISPSIIVVNTCTVTSKADQKARRVIRKALRDYPDSAVLVTGCYAQLNQDELYKLETERPRRLFVIKGMDKDSIINLSLSLSKKKDICGALEILHENEIADSRQNVHAGRAFQFNPEHFSDHTRSFLKIQDGCDKHCTYCRISLARGPSVSLDAEQVLARLCILEKKHAEAVLTGVNISQYRDLSGALNSASNIPSNNLGGLLEYLLCGTSTISIRLSSLAPDSIDGEFAKILSNKRIRPHFHLSIQSGSKKIIEKMGRNYNAETVERAVNLLRSAKDDPFLACDIITGFPGETETEFNATFELCRKIGFSWIHVFPYSKRPGTSACSFSGAVQEKEISRRVRLLTDLAWQGRVGYVNRWLGREVDVLIEKGRYAKPFCRGISENYLKLFVQYRGDKPPFPGTVLRCRIIADQDIWQNIEKNKNFDAIALDILT